MPDDERPLGGGEMIRLVARREVRERMRAKSFLVGTGLLVVLIVAVGLVGRFAAGGDEEAVQVGVAAGAAGDAAGAAPAEDDVVAAVEDAAAAADRQVEVTFLDDAGAARTAVDEGDVDVAVLPDDGQALFGEDVDDRTLAIVQQAWSRLAVEGRLAEAGLGPAEVTDALSVPPLEAVTLTGDDEQEDEALGVLIGTVSAILLFGSLQTFGTYVLTGVVEEKSSAVVEVLLVRARSDQLLAGKVIGIGIAGLAQFAAAVAAGLVSLALSGVDVPGAIWSSVPMMLVWFLGGFALYATLFALAGSLVSRQEDAQSAAAPVTYGLLAGYVLVFLFGYVPDSTASTVLSLVPPVAPFLMPMRMAAGAASVVEVVVAAAGLLLATLAAWKLAGRIYEQVLLRRGSRIAWRDALALVRRG